MLWGNDFSWSSIFLISFGTALWVALLVALVWALILRINKGTTIPAHPPTSAPPTGPSALEILSQRYARGEIDAATFEQMRERLETLSTPAYQQNYANQSQVPK
jgi:putative membrane protein